MSVLFYLFEDWRAERKEKKAEKKRMLKQFRLIEDSENRKFAPPPSLDLQVGWTEVDGKRIKMSPFQTVLEQISSVDVRTIKPHFDLLRSTMDKAEKLGVTAEPFTLAFVGPPRQGKTQIGKNILKILGALGMVCVERSAQDGYCDDLARAAEAACEAKDEQGKLLYFPNITDPARRLEKCKVEVLLLDEFQSKVEDPSDVPMLLNGVVPLQWKPLMADMNYKGMSFNPVIWIMSCNNEFVQHKYSVTAIRDRMHRRLVVLDGKAYDQTCKRDLDPSGDFLGGFRTCKGTFGVWDTHVTQRTVGYSVGAFNNSAISAGLAPSSSTSSGSSTTSTVGKSVSNQKFRDIKDTLNIDQPRCEHMRYVPFTDLIVQLLDAAQAKLEVAIKGTEAINARIEVIRQTMIELSAEAEPITGCASVGYEGAPSVTSDYASLFGSTPEPTVYRQTDIADCDGWQGFPESSRPSLFQ